MSRRSVQVALIVAGLGAIVAATGLLGIAGEIAGTLIVLAVTVLVAPAAERGSGPWWQWLAAAAALLCFGQLLTLLAAGLGGLVSIAAAVGVVAASVAGFPSDG